MAGDRAEAARVLLRVWHGARQHGEILALLRRAATLALSPIYYLRCHRQFLPVTTGYYHASTRGCLRCSAVPPRGKGLATRGARAKHSFLAIVSFSYYPLPTVAVSLAHRIAVGVRGPALAVARLAVVVPLERTLPVLREDAAVLHEVDGRGAREQQLLPPPGRVLHVRHRRYLGQLLQGQQHLRRARRRALSHAEEGLGICYA